MNPETEKDILGENLRRALDACDAEKERSYAEFLRRVEGRAVATRRSPAGVLTLAASILVCAGVLAVILSSGGPPPENAPAVPAQDEKVKKPTAVSEEQSLQAQIAFQEKLLEKTADEQERALVQATIKTLRTELARVQKGKGAPKAKGDPGDDRAAKLKAELDSIYTKMKNAPSDDEKSRLETRAREIGQELKLLEQGNKKDVNPGDSKFKKSSDDFGALLDRSRELLDQKNGAQAIQELDQRIAKKPDDAPAYLVRGITQAMSGNMEKANADVKRGAELDPSAKSSIDYAWGTLKKIGQMPVESNPKEMTPKKGATKESAPSPKEIEQRIASLNDRLAELQAMEANKDLSEEERAKSGKEAARVQAEIEKLRGSAHPEKKKP